MDAVVAALGDAADEPDRQQVLEALEEVQDRFPAALSPSCSPMCRSRTWWQRTCAMRFSHPTRGSPRSPESRFPSFRHGAGPPNSDRRARHWWAKSFARDSLSRAGRHSIETWRRAHRRCRTWRRREVAGEHAAAIDHRRTSDGVLEPRSEGIDAHGLPTAWPGPRACT